LDHQVKIRGFRIELGEIETVLRQHGQVREAAVLAREDAPGLKRLAAYVVAREEGTPSVAELRAFLGAKLPEYMTPAAFVFLESLPLTPNGKLDRKSLPAPGGERPEIDKVYVEPETTAERALARIWAEVLRLDKVGTGDNFFALGGDSILAIQVVSRARRAGFGLTPRQLFQHQTLGELAAAAATVSSVAEQSVVTGSVPLTPVQSWFFEQELANPNHYNQSLLLTVRERLDLRALERAISHLLRHHDALRLRFNREANGWRQEMTDEAVAELVWQVVDLSNVAETEQAEAITAAAAEIQARFVLASGPLTRLAYFDLGQERPGRLLWATHHLAVDGVSWRVLLEDLWTVYQQARSNQPLSLPAKTTSFKSWAGLLDRSAHSAKLAAEADYWLDESWSTVAPLPMDKPNERQISSGHIEIVLEEDETTTLLREAPKAYRTRIDEALLAGLVRACSNWTGRDEVVVDLEAHGREPELLSDWFDEIVDADLTRTVGWFTTIYPVLLSVAAGASPSEDLRNVKEQVRRVPHGGLGYGLLRYGGGHIEIAERLRALPTASVLFNYLGQLDGVLEHDGPLSPATESAGPNQDPRQKLSHPLIVNASVRHGRLRFSCTYDAAVFHRETVERWADLFQEALRALATHCQSPDAGGYTPSDFPLAELSADDLAEMSQLLEEIS
jgi:non-ribosomal peptide synthase protein (TIGR01720 family)